MYGASVILNILINLLKLCILFWNPVSTLSSNNFVIRCTVPIVLLLLLNLISSLTLEHEILNPNYTRWACFSSLPSFYFEATFNNVKATHYKVGMFLYLADLWIGPHIGIPTLELLFSLRIHPFFAVWNLASTPV